MKNIKISIHNRVIKLVFLLMLLGNAGLSFADNYSFVDECADQITSTEFTGNYIVYLSRDGSDPIPFNSAIAYAGAGNVLNCDPRVTAIEIANNNYSTVTATTGETLLVLNAGSSDELFANNSTNFGWRFGYDEPGVGEGWGTGYSTILIPGPFTNNQMLRFKLMFASLTTTVPREATLKTYGGNAYGYLRISGPKQVQRPLSVNITVQEILTSCNILSSLNQSVTWTLTPDQISDNQAEEKNTPISINCGGIVTPVKMKVTASNGVADATNGIINTSLKNLGLKLTWTSSGQPVNFNTFINDSLLGQKNYDITAKPIQIGDAKVAAGNFSTTVTVAFEYR